MFQLYLSPASISYLAEFVLSFALTLYFVYHWRKPESDNTQSALQLLFFAFITLYIGLLFLDASLLFQAYIATDYLLNLSMALALLFLTQATYHSPKLHPRLKLESQITLAAGIAYVMFEFVVAIYRFSILVNGQVVAPIQVSEYIAAFWFLFIATIILRQALYAEKVQNSLTDLARILAKPQNAYQKTARVTALLYVFIFVFSLFSSVLYSGRLVSYSIYQMVDTTGVLFALFCAFLIYLNYQFYEITFRLKIVGTALLISMSVFSLIGWTIAPWYTSTFQFDLPTQHTTHFAPNATGGYDVIATRFTFDMNWGERLAFPQNADKQSPLDLNFPFTFYGKRYNTLYVGDKGIVGVGRLVNYENIQNNYGATPAIFPLYMDDLDTSAGGVYARQTNNELLLTWDGKDVRQPNNRYTFQMLVRADGSFDLRYKTTPLIPVMYADEPPESSFWLIGAIPGNLSISPEFFNINHPTGQSNGAQGFVSDYYLMFRKFQNQIFLPLLFLLLINSLLVVIGLPVMIQYNVVKPLQDLLAGVSRVQVGDLNVELPVQYRDEFGVLTGSFNTIVAQLRTHLSELEQRVAERTQDLQTANELLQEEIKKHEETEMLLTEQQRKVVVTEEREQMARDLQDSFGQLFGYINVQAQAARTLLQKGQIEAAQENLQLLVQAAQGAHGDLRKYILGLRDIKNYPHSFFESLRTYLDAFSRAWEIETVFSPPQDTLPILSETVEDQFLQIMQEALVNIRKHANAKRVEVLMTFLPREMIMIISDNGRGFDPQTAPGVEQKRFGLSIMRERAEQIGGRVELRSVVGQGTQVVVHIPRIVSSAQKRAPRELLGLRILLADDQPLFLEGLRNLLTARGLIVIGMARDGNEAVEQVRALRPDLVLMDVQMPNYSGIEATQLIKAEFPEIKVALLATTEDENDLISAIKMGVAGYILKNMDVNEIFARLVEIIHGGLAIPPVLVSNLLNEIPSAREENAEGLTTRQWEILQLAAKGLTYKEVAQVLSISEVTVKYHMGQIMERLNVKNREQAVMYALRVMSK